MGLPMSSVLREEVILKRFELRSIGNPSQAESLTYFGNKKSTLKGGAFDQLIFLSFPNTGGIGVSIYTLGPGTTGTPFAYRFLSTQTLG